MKSIDYKQAVQDFLRHFDGNVDEAQKALAQFGGVVNKKKQPKIPEGAEKIAVVRSVTKRYKLGKSTVEALKGVDLDIYKGEFVAITGASGSGKSTLLQLIGGLDKPTTGEITVDGSDLSKLSDKELSQFRNKKTGFVFQFFFLQPFLNLQQNIGVPAMFARTSSNQRDQQAVKLAGVVGLEERVKHLPRELSGGQMQRAAIARALQNSPSLLLADEPTGNLDHSNARAIFELFQNIRESQGTTVVVVTHDQELAAMADRIIEIQDGEVVA